MDNYDIALTIDSVYKELDLARDSKGRPIYEVTELPRNLDDNDKLFEQTDWYRGFGDGDFKVADKYADGSHIDTTNKGQIILGPNIATMPVLFFLYRCEACDGGVYTDNLAASRNATANDMTLLPAVPQVNDAYYFGCDNVPVGLYIYIGTAGVGTWTITWEYWNGSAWTALSSVSDGTSGFCPASTGLKYVTWTAPANHASTTVDGDDAYWVRARVSAYTSVTTQPKGTRAWWRFATNTSGGSNFAMCQFNSTTYTSRDQRILEWDNTNSYWVQRYAADYDITDLCVYGNKMYVGFGSYDTYCYTTDGDTYTDTDLIQHHFSYFITAQSLSAGLFTLWGAINYELWSTTDPVAGGIAWSGPKYIGESTTNINSLMIHNNMLFIGKPDGLYHLDSSGAVDALLPDMKVAQSSNNFKYHCNYKGELYFSLNTRLGKISSGMSYKVIGPYHDIEDIVIKGTCVGLSADNNYLYCAMYDGTNYVIYKGFEIEEDKWSWCPIYTTTLAISKMMVSMSGTNTVLWFDRYIYLTRIILSDNPLADSSYQFYSSGYVITPWYDAGARDWDKIISAINCECRGYDVNTGGVDLSATVYVSIYYEVNESGTWTLIDSAYTDNNSGATRKYIDASTLANGKKIRFKILLTSDDTTITPIVKLFMVYGKIKPPLVRIYNFAIDVDPREYEASKTKYDFLMGGRTTTALITMIDVYGTTRYVTIPPNGITAKYLQSEVGQEPRMLMYITAYEEDWVL